jgi:hypothetical protein
MKKPQDSRTSISFSSISSKRIASVINILFLGKLGFSFDYTPKSRFNKKTGDVNNRYLLIHTKLKVRISNNKKKNQRKI